MKENKSKYAYGPSCSAVFHLNYHNDSKSILAPFNPFSTLQPKGSFENSHQIMCHPSSSNPLMMFTALPIKSKILIKAHKALQTLAPAPPHSLPSSLNGFL